MLLFVTEDGICVGYSDSWLLPKDTAGLPGTVREQRCALGSPVVPPFGSRWYCTRGQGLHQSLAAVGVLGLRPGRLKACGQ